MVSEVSWVNPRFCSIPKEPRITRALLTSELEEVFANAPPAPNDLAHPHVREAYEQATGKKVDSNSKGSGPQKRIPGPETDCPVCYEDMHGTKENQLAFCESCGNCLHKQCFDQCKTHFSRGWNRADRFNIGAKTKGRDITCVFCRAKWYVASNAAPGGSRKAQVSEGYLNLASAAGLSPVRDTSSCRLPPYPSMLSLTLFQIIMALDEDKTSTVINATVK